MFGRFLKVTDHCDVCGEPFHHHRADDFPAYLDIAIVGHLVVPAELFAEIHYALPDWTLPVLWLPLTVLLAVGLLQPIKGIVVAWQWRLGMHGFGGERRIAAFGAAPPHAIESTHPGTSASVFNC
jgi:uncharacterized protein (DUF983 family)